MALLLFTNVAHIKTRPGMQLTLDLPNIVAVDGGARLWDLIGEMLGKSSPVRTELRV